ncbi:MFS general substrate transporter [Aspergillus steynii IBT 23096]|uniref:MFS general substrate transporter n=1 Tax=Aspergillus steynii IBT 23096 TaxID=1392250 RepID=A0A2I2G9W8_9EURO|nr:MFS general substrate transporter [Aspergillus steynii IBT 23096]PLB49677.1 MFS general substrate transporter [Aspergillus steynii IBT 23096]
MDHSADQRPFRNIICSFLTCHIPKDLSPPPDGGFHAWSQVLWSHFTVCNAWGYVTTFGVFQTYYTQKLNASPSAISWIGSVQVFLLFSLGAFSGRMSDAGYFKAVWGSGALLTLIGIFMASLSTEYWQVFLSQGLCLGIGSGLMFCPILSLLPTYFSKNRSLAIGLAATGSSTGGLVFPAVVDNLLPRIGFPWTMRILGFLTLAMLTPSFIFLKPRMPPRKGGPIVEWNAFREFSYLMFSLGMFLVFWGLYVAFFYISSFARTLGATQSVSISLLLIMNGVGVPARVLPNLLADKYTGPVNLLVPVAMISSIALFSWISVVNISGLYVFAVFYGLFSASLQSLFPASLASLTVDLSKIGVRTGMILTVVSFAALTGSPIAGALVQRGNGSYKYAQIFAAVSMFVGTLLLVVARASKTGLRLNARM